MASVTSAAAGDRLRCRSSRASLMSWALTYPHPRRSKWPNTCRTERPAEACLSRMICRSLRATRSSLAPSPSPDAPRHPGVGLFVDRSCPSPYFSSGRWHPRRDAGASVSGASLAGPSYRSPAGGGSGVPMVPRRFPLPVCTGTGVDGGFSPLLVGRHLSTNAVSSAPRCSRPCTSLSFSSLRFTPAAALVEPCLDIAGAQASPLPEPATLPTCAQLGPLSLHSPEPPLRSGHEGLRPY